MSHSKPSRRDKATHNNRKCCNYCQTKLPHHKLYCSRCFSVCYCNNKCQSLDWKKSHHKSCFNWQNHSIGTTLATKLYQHTGAYTKHALENVIFKTIFEYHIDNDIQGQLLRREGKLFRDVIASSINPNRFIINVPGDFLLLNDAIEAWNCSNCTKVLERLIQPGRHELTDVLLHQDYLVKDLDYLDQDGERTSCCGLNIRGVLDQDGKKPTICGVGRTVDDYAPGTFEEFVGRNYDITYLRWKSPFTEIFINGKSTTDIRFVNLDFENVRLKVGSARDIFATRCENIRIEPESKSKITLTDCTQWSLQWRPMQHTLLTTSWLDVVNVDDDEVETRIAATECRIMADLADGNDDDEDENEQEIQRSHHRIQKQIIKYETKRQSSRKKRNQMTKQKRNKHRSFGKDRQHYQRRR